MKKLILLIIIFLQGLWMVQAQDVTDGLRYGLDGLKGTARYVSMSGAFGALGGDLSAMNENPASSAVFLSNQSAFSFDLEAYKNKTLYRNETNDNRNNSFDLSQVGAVFVFNNYNESADVTRISLGINYNQNRSLDNRFRAIGTSDETVSDMFLNFAQGVPLDFFTPRSGETLSDLYDYLGYANEGFNNNRLQAGYLGYEAYLFDPVNPNDMNNTQYVSNVSGNTFNHLYEQYEDGNNGKLNFNFGMALKDQFYLGLNLNSHFVNYHQTLFINEGIPGNSVISEINYGNYLDVTGSGFSFQLGGIARVGDMFRVGATYESPTWYRIGEETHQILRTYNTELAQEIIVNPRVINVFPTYSLRTPGKWTGSVAAVFGGNGLLSFDYSYKDYSNTKFSSHRFSDENAQIDDQLQAVSSFRLGGEYRIKDLSLRAGFRYEQSPYKNEQIGDLTGYSAGFGYDFGGMKIDLAYALAKRDIQADLLQTGFTHQAEVKNTLSNYVLSVVFPL